ncbi:hypothetical protein CEXT_732351 [Caerostris extrusa]|uniref:Uncharacterized protein n=1 Tax=Caerostris extrusa TaxID=172846 RepID=A0AAV4UYM6_CAEEX|nr:hypothetical protein CEXT_732351 [Caerostris extrusa]
MVIANGITRFDNVFLILGLHRVSWVRRSLKLILKNKFFHREFCRSRADGECISNARKYGSDENDEDQGIVAPHMKGRKTKLQEHPASNLQAAR